MKKLMIAAAIVCAAAFAQASSCDWAAANDWVYSINADKGINTYESGTVGTYWMVALTGNSTAGISVGADGKLVMDSSVGKVATAAGGGDATGAFSSGEGIIPGGTIEVYAKDNGSYYALVIYDSDNGLYGVSDTVMMTGVQDEPAPVAGDKMNFSNHIASEWDDPTAYMTANTAVAAVPEPTSGLLLLLGVAGMALRRRRA